MSANEYEVPCPMPECGNPLAITWLLSYSLSPGDVTDGARTPGIDWHHSSTYEIACIAGHVLVLPPDTAEDSYDLDDDAIARLRKIICTLAPGTCPACAVLAEAQA